MGVFKKKGSDPLSERERALNDEIAALEAQIKSLSSGKASTSSAGPVVPKLRSTTLPHHAAMVNAASATARNAAAAQAESGDPIFEDVDQSVLQGVTNSGKMTEEERKRYFNDLGVRKYDLVSLVRRIVSQLSGPAAPDSKLYKYLAAGSVQGLRPLRYEKRVARNRSLFVVTFIFIILMGAFLYMFTGR